MFKWIRNLINLYKWDRARRNLLNSLVEITIQPPFSYIEKYEFVSGKMLDREPLKWFRERMSRDIFKAMVEETDFGFERASTMSVDEVATEIKESFSI